MKAWHFVNDKLRDGRPIPADGEKLIHGGELEMCASGLHASLEPFDALQYAPGKVLCHVECGGEIIKGVDKLVCSERTIIKRMDVEWLLWQFAREQALSVIHLWDAPDVVKEYLTTGNEELRAAAWAEAGAEAGAAARAAARAAAWAAAWDAARAAAGAEAGAGAEAWDAAWDAAWAAAWAEARKRFNEIIYSEFGVHP